MNNDRNDHNMNRLEKGLFVLVYTLGASASVGFIISIVDAIVWRMA